MTGERSSYEISTDSTSRPLWANASATRSTLVEKGALKRRSIIGRVFARGRLPVRCTPPAVPGDPPDRGVLCPAALTDRPAQRRFIYGSRPTHCAALPWAGQPDG